MDDVSGDVFMVVKRAGVILSGKRAGLVLSGRA